MVDSGRPCPDMSGSLSPSRELSLGVRPTDWSAPLPARGMPDVRTSVRTEKVVCVEGFVVAVDRCYSSSQPSAKARTVLLTVSPDSDRLDLCWKVLEDLASLSHQGIVHLQLKPLGAAHPSLNRLPHSFLGVPNTQGVPWAFLSYRKKR